MIERAFNFKTCGPFLVTFFILRVVNLFYIYTEHDSSAPSDPIKEIQKCLDNLKCYLQFSTEFFKSYFFFLL